MEIFDSQTNTSSIDYKKSDDIFIVVRLTVCLIVSSMGIVGNIVNIIVIPRLPNTTLSEASRVVFVALGIANLVTCTSYFIGSPLLIVEDEWIWENIGGTIFCDVVGFTGSYGPAISASLLFLINLDRYIQITRPLTYHTIVTQQKAVIAVLVSLFYILVLFIPFIGVHGHESITHQPGISLCLLSFTAPSFLPYTIATFSLSVWLVAVQLIVMYGRIIQITRKHLKTIARQRKSVEHFRDSVVQTRSNGPGDHGAQVVEKDGHVANKDEKVRKIKRDFESIRRNLRSLKLPILVTGFYLFAWLPITIVFTLASAANCTISKPIWGVCAAIIGGHMATNTFVYILSNNDFRKEVAKIVCKCRRRPYTM